MKLPQIYGAKFFTGHMQLLLTDQECQSTEGKYYYSYLQFLF